MITFSLELISPAKAQKYLDSNAGNQRHISENWVVTLAEMMENGTFNGLDGQTIKFATVDGKETLIDGQHRLSAVVLAERSVKLGVMRGLSESAFRTQDQLKTRTVENFYQIANQDYAKTASQIAKWLFNTEHGGSILGANIKVIPGLIAQWALVEHPTIPRVVEQVADQLSEFQKVGIGTKAHLGFCYYAWQKLDPVYAAQVVDFYATGEGRVSGTINAARQWLLKEGVQDRAKNLAGNQRLQKVVNTLNVVWNVDRSGKKNLRSISRLMAPYLRVIEGSKSWPTGGKDSADKRQKLQLVKAA